MPPTSTCTPHPAGQEVVFECGNGMRLQGPADGGLAIGTDADGRSIDGMITYRDGAYTLVVY
jgi:hypothetical protein